MKEMSVGITFTQSCAWKPDWKLHWLPLAGDFEGRRPCGRMCCVCVCIDVWGDALMEGTLGLLSAPHNHKTERHAPSTLAIIHTHRRRRKPSATYSRWMRLRLRSHLKGKSPLWPPSWSQGKLPWYIPGNGVCEEYTWSVCPNVRQLGSSGRHVG